MGEFAARLNIERTTLRGHLKNFEAEGHTYTKMPHPSRPSEMLRHFTPEQQETFIAWWSKRKR